MSIDLYILILYAVYMNKITGNLFKIAIIILLLMIYVRLGAIQENTLNTYNSVYDGFNQTTDNLNSMNSNLDDISAHASNIEDYTSNI